MGTRKDLVLLFTGSKKFRMRLAKKKSKSNTSSNKKSSAAQYVICVNSRNYPASLESRKIYKLVPDRAAAGHGLLRVIDESGEDYLYPAGYFVAIKLPQNVEKAVQMAS
jgi:hypothetical protein